MILGKIRVQNFKSIIDTGYIYLSKGDLITILAGQNESGKTSLLRALKFFEEGNYDSFEENDRRLETFPRIDCTFYLNDSEYESLSSLVGKKIAEHIRKNGFTLVRGSTEKDSFDKLSYIYPDELKKMVEEFKNEQIALEAAGGIPSKFEPFEYFNNIRPQMISYSSFTESILPARIKYSDLHSNQAVKDFETIYDVDFKELLNPATKDQKRAREVERIRNEASQSLNTYWKQKISGEEVNYKFIISPNSEQSNINNGYVNFFINQGDDAQLSIGQKSQGFQWFVGFNLRLKSHEKELDSNGLILLIDEPGQGLHETAQNDVRNVLEELADTSGIQIIYSTHQPTLLGRSEVDFSRLLLVDRTIEDGTKFKTLTQLISSNGSLDSLSPIRTALGMVGMINPFQGDKKTLICEGVTEYFYLKTLFKDSFVVIPSTGVDQVPNIFAIMYGWGISAKVLIDDDSQGNAAYKKIKKSFFSESWNEVLLDETILKVTGKNGIEDFLSIEIISSILLDFGKKFDSGKSKTENVEQVGKIIFAKTFFDTYSTGSKKLDKETIDNFELIKKFVSE